MSHDRKFLDTFALIIAALVLFSIAMLVLSKLIGGKTQGVFIAEDPAVVGQVEERISPVGQVAIAGQPAPERAAPPATPAPADEPAATMDTQTAAQDMAQSARETADEAITEVASAATEAAETVAAQADVEPETAVAAVTTLASAAQDGPSGESVYNGACSVCHGAGIAGAPKLGVAAAWESRIAKGKDTLYANAINGYMGEAGVMPAKGGRVDLSDDEVRAAVDYMVSQSR